MRLLLLEDQKTSAETLIKALKEIDTNYQIDHVTTVAQAIEKLESGQSFDVALVDLGLPDAEGDQAPASICSLYSELAVVVYTGESNARLASDIMRLGAQDYINKGEYGAVAIDRVLRLAIQRNHRVNSLKQVANSDELTGLLNRRGLQTAMESIIAGAGSTNELQLALFSIDLDGFKTVNDSFGHPIGDTLLQQCAHRIEGTVRVSDSVARGGGDEFFLVCEGLVTPDEIVGVADKLLAVISAPYSINNHRISISASIGVACIPNDVASVKELYIASDAALYDAKAKGKNNAVMYCQLQPQASPQTTTTTRATQGNLPEVVSKRFHQLNNELNVITLEADLIRLVADVAASPQVDKSVERIHQQCKVLFQLLSQLKDDLGK